MAEAFDPYHKWLGVKAKDRPPNQPPNHYRLLGIDLFESDLEVIQHAADKQMAAVKQFERGKHSAESQKILNELAAARVSLLNAEKKAEYDRQLGERETVRAQSGVVEALGSAPQGAWARIEKAQPDDSEYRIASDAPDTQGAAPAVGVPPHRPRTLSDALMERLAQSADAPAESSGAVTGASEDSDFAFLSAAVAQPKPSAAPPEAPPPAESKPRKKLSTPHIVVIVGGALGLLLVVLLLVLTPPETPPPREGKEAAATRKGKPPVGPPVPPVRGGAAKGTDGTLVFDWPRSHREGLNVSLDGKEIRSLPASGALNVPCTPGNHTIRVARASFSCEWPIQVEAGKDVPVPAPALLELAWPVGERSGATLFLGAKGTQIPMGGPDILVIPLGPDLRSVDVLITRPGYAPYLSAVKVVKGSVARIPVKLVPDGREPTQPIGQEPGKSPESGPGGEQVLKRLDESDASADWSPTNILTWVQPTRDRDIVSGRWFKDGATVLLKTKEAQCRIRLPVKVQGNFDLRMTFTRYEGKYVVGIVFPVGSHTCNLGLGHDGKSGLENIDHKSIGSNSTTQGGLIQNGRKYTVELRVRPGSGAQGASIKAFLDGQVFIVWRGNEASLNASEYWALPPRRDAGEIGLIAHSSIVTFHSVQLRTGTYTPLGSEDPSGRGQNPKVKPPSSRKAPTKSSGKRPRL